MSYEFDDVNKKYNDETFPVFPYIDKEKVTLLSRGLYRKHKAKYRGVTAVYNEEKNKFEFPLYGMYKVEENLVIVPEGANFDGTKSAILNSAIKAGFRQVNRPPLFETIYFDEDTEEAKLALVNRSFYKNKSETLNNKNITI